MLVLNCYSLKGSVHCTPLFQAWTESQEMVRMSALEGTQVYGTCCSFPLRETDTTRHRVGADRSVSWIPGPCKLQYWGPGCACLLQAAPPPTPEAAEEAELCPPSSLSQTQTSPALTRERWGGASGVCIPTWKHGVGTSVSPNKCDKCLSSLF